MKKGRTRNQHDDYGSIRRDGYTYILEVDLFKSKLGERFMHFNMGEITRLCIGSFSPMFSKCSRTLFSSSDIMNT